MNDFEQKSLAFLRQQYPLLTEIKGSFTFECLYCDQEGDACAQIPFGEWHWYLRDSDQNKETNLEWFSWFKNYLFEDLQRYIAFRAREYQHALERSCSIGSTLAVTKPPSGGKVDFVYGKLSLQWFCS